VRAALGTSRIGTGDPVSHAGEIARAMAAKVVRALFTQAMATDAAETRSINAVNIAPAANACARRLRHLRQANNHAPRWPRAEQKSLQLEVKYI